MRRIVATICCLVVVSGAMASESLDEIEKKLNAAYAKLTSFSSDMQMTQDIQMEQMSMKMDVKGQMKWQRQGEKVRFHVEQTGKSETNFGGQANSQDVETLMVSDGDFVYTVQRDMMGQRTATKSKTDPRMNGDTTMMFEGMKQTGEVTVAADEEFDGADCYCILVTLPAQPGNPMASQKFWFRKDIGMMVKMIATNDKGDEVMSNISRNIKTGVNFNDSDFKFVAPEGVVVQDLTSMGQPGQPQTTP